MAEWEDVDHEQAWSNPHRTNAYQASSPVEQNNMHWEPVEDEPSEGNPFGGVEQVDGIVYSDQEISPELQYQQQSLDVPLPPVRPQPQPQIYKPAEPWKPGPDPVQPKINSDPRVFKAVLTIVIPLVFVAGLCYLVYRLMTAYGLPT